VTSLHPIYEVTATCTFLSVNFVWLANFWATVCKTVRPILSDRCLSSLSVCLWRRCIVAKRLDGSSCHLVWRYNSAQATLC